MFKPNRKNKRGIFFAPLLQHDAGPGYPGSAFFYFHKRNFGSGKLYFVRTKNLQRKKRRCPDTDFRAAGGLIFYTVYVIIYPSVNKEV